MFTPRKLTSLVLGAALVMALGVSKAMADEYPSKPISLVLPLGAGGSHDLNSRVFTSIIPSYLGQAMVVKLMPGASGQKGTAHVANAKPGEKLVTSMPHVVRYFAPKQSKYFVYIPQIS